MIPNEYSYNKNANYRYGCFYNISVTEKDLVQQNITVELKSGQSFPVTFTNVFENYKIAGVSSDLLVQRWNQKPLLYFQNQLNFAVALATSGCGVSARMIKQHEIFKFHTYYQIRRILSELKCRLPNDKDFNAYNNPYDHNAFDRLCREFDSLHADWRQTISANHGLGEPYFYVTNTGYEPVYPYQGPYSKGRMSFTHKTTNQVVHIDFIKQTDKANDAWSRFIVDETDGFTKAGVIRINDSIRTYVWAILGSQGQTRTSILGEGTAFDAQKQFLANVEDAISRPVDLPEAVKRYQEVLRFARSKVDFVFGVDLYMAPSDMDLHIGSIVNYNNEIVIATANDKLGFNVHMNSKPAVVTKVGKPLHIAKKEVRIPPPSPYLTQEHEDEKRAIILVGIMVTIASLWA